MASRSASIASRSAVRRMRLVSASGVNLGRPPARRVVALRGNCLLQAARRLDGRRRGLAAPRLSEGAGRRRDQSGAMGAADARTLASGGVQEVT